MMTWYWEVDHMATLEKRLCQHNEEKISTKKIIIWTSWTMNIISKPTQVIMVAISHYWKNISWLTGYKFNILDTEEGTYIPCHISQQKQRCK